MDEPRSAPVLQSLRIDRSRRPGRRRLRRVLLLALAAALALVVALAFILTRPPVVALAEVREARPGEAATTLSAAGYVASRRRSIVAPKIAGRLDELLVQEGERVDEGELLARLDDDDARVAIEQAVSTARAAEARIAASQAAAAKAELDLSRTRQLVATGALPREALDQDETRARAAAADERAARAERAAAQAAAAAARLTLQHTEIRAPFAGTVVRKLADEGAVLAPATISAVEVGGIVELVDLDALEVEAEVSEDELARIRDGQPALIFLDAYPDNVYRGAVTAVRPTIDRAKATAVVKVRFAGPAEGVLPNMGARVSFLAEDLPSSALQHEARLRVPATAVVERGGEPVVFVVEDRRARRAPVEVAGQTGGEAILRAGPPPGSKVVSEPGDRLRDGARVRVEEAAP